MQIPQIEADLIEWYETLPPVAQEAFMVEVAQEVAKRSAKEEFSLEALPPQDLNAGHYIRQNLGWQPWAGTDSQPGQQQIIDAYNLAVRQQIEKARYELGEIGLNDLETWQPGQVIQNWIRVESGNLTGKTKIAGGLFSHFFDTFPSIVYTFAPSWEQIQDLLWKEIRRDRRRGNCLGTVLDGKPRLNYTEDRFAVGRATNDSQGTGIERIQGQHNPYLMYIVDEAEGVSDVVYEALEGMDTGIVVIVMLLANPRTRSSRFHRIRTLPYVVNFRINTLTHPNVVQNKQLIPGAATRDWVRRRLENEEYADLVDEHDEDANTFEVEWLPGKIFRPKSVCFWRILGLAPTNIADDTFCPLGRYEGAKKRDPYDGDDPTHAWLGLDCARFGSDDGTLYVRHAGVLRRAALFSQRRQTSYARRTKAVIQSLVRQGVKNIELRVDAGGGYGGGVVDILLEDGDIQRGIDLTTGDVSEQERQAEQDHPFFGLESFRVIEVHYNGIAHDESAFFDRATEMYYHLGEALKVIRLDDPPSRLEQDVCERSFEWKKKKGIDVKRLVDKDIFRKKYKHSPDNGDGAALACAPSHLFKPKWRKQEFLSV